MSISVRSEETGEGDAHPTQLLDLPKDIIMWIFQALDLESLVTVARTSKAVNQAAQSDSLWMERCRQWENVVALKTWRGRMDSGKALFRLLRSFSRLVGAWIHSNIPVNPRGILIYITWGGDGLEGWKVRQMIQDAGNLTFDKMFEFRGRQDGSCEFIKTTEETMGTARRDPPDVAPPSTVRREASDVIFPSLQSYDELFFPGTGRRSAEGKGYLYKRLKVGVPKPGQDLAGLWTGLYYMHGWEILNLTYTDGNCVIATKVTGDPNVPSGEMSFIACLRREREDPLLDFEIPRSNNEPPWTRYPGQGRIADEIYRNPSWVPGALLLGCNKNLRFVWQLYGDIDYRRFDLEESYRKMNTRETVPQRGSPMQYVGR